MKLTKRQYLYIICGIIVICCIGINTYRQNQRREAMRIEAHYKSIYEVEKKEQLAALQSMYDGLVIDIKNYRKSNEWREERLKGLCSLLGYRNYYGCYWVDDFAEVQRKHRNEDKEEMINIAERHAKAAEARARSEKSGEAK